MIKLITIVVVTSCVFQPTYTDIPSNKKAEDGALKELLQKLNNPNNYTKMMRPGNMSESTTVTVSAYLRNVRICDKSMQSYIDITLRMRWRDTRLQFDDSLGRIRYLSLLDPSMIWIPDIFFRKSEKTTQMKSLQDENYIRIFPNGDVLYSTRLMIKSRCPMNLKLYPHDEQQCQIQIASYRHSIDDINLVFKQFDPLQVWKSLNIPRYQLTKFSHDYCNVLTATGEYSCLRFDLFYKRYSSIHVLNFYVPCVCMVMTGMISIMLSNKHVQARLFLSTVTFVVLFLFVSENNREIPAVAYTKAIDVFSGCNFICSWLILVHACFGFYCYDHLQKSAIDGRVSNLVQRIQFITRILIPASYIAFLVVYTIVYYSYEPDNYMNENVTYVA